MPCLYRKHRTTAQYVYLGVSTGESLSGDPRSSRCLAYFLGTFCARLLPGRDC